MPIRYPKPGPNDTSEYLKSGVPFLTASTLSRNDIFEINLPYVSRFIKVRNDEPTAGTKLAFGITLSGTLSSSAGGLGKNYLNVPSNSTETFEIRTKTFFLSNSAGNTTNGSIQFQICAGLTGIEEFPVLTGSLLGTASFKGVG